MIIQCEQCRTKFKLDDTRVPDKGVKVRCAKCRHIFSVAKDQTTSGPVSDFESMLDASVSSEMEMADVQHEFAAADETSEIEFEEAPSALESHTVPADMDKSARFEIEDVQEDISSSAIHQDLSTSEEDSMFPPVKIEPDDSMSDMDFGSFDFGDDDTSTTAPSTLDFSDTPKVEPAQVSSKSDDFGGLDFTGDDMFGEVVPSAPEESAEEISFDSGMDDFAASMGFSDSASSQKSNAMRTDALSDSPFSLDEIDFGDEFTSVGVQHVNPDKLQPSQELLFAPLAEAQAKPVQHTDSTSPWSSQTTQQELPPLSIASRRKQNPLFTGLAAAVGIFVLCVIAFFGYSIFSGGKTNTAQEKGRITLHDVDATFVKNKLTGDLLVITGEAVNDFNQPRAALQIKGMVFGADGEVLASKNAFCGNPLTDEQLATMPLDKIETAMANQFGDSLANMEVAPKKSIPFVIVIANPPAGAKDYGVEPAGSTVATDKPQ